MTAHEKFKHDVGILLKKYYTQTAIGKVMAQYLGKSPASYGTSLCHQLNGTHKLSKKFLRQFYAIFQADLDEASGAAKHEVLPDPVQSKDSYIVQIETLKKINEELQKKLLIALDTNQILVHLLKGIL